MTQDEQSRLSPRELYEMDTWEPWRERLGRWVAVVAGLLLFAAGIGFVALCVHSGELPRRSGAVFFMCFIVGPGVFVRGLVSFRRRRRAREEAEQALRESLRTEQN